MPNVAASRVLTSALLGALLASTAPVMAAHAAADPAIDQVEALDAALIQTMKAGHAAGAEGRFKIMAPAVDAAFDLRTMARFIVGPDWSSLSPGERTAVVTAFRRFTIANYAKNFRGYSGQVIKVSPDVMVRGIDKVVKTQLTGGGANVSLAYRMRESDHVWKVIDVFYNGSISQMTTERSDFAQSLSDGGAKGLAKALDAQAEKLLK